MEKIIEWKKVLATILVSFLAIFFILDAAYVVAAPPKFLTLPLQKKAVVGNAWHYSLQSDDIPPVRESHSAIDYYVDEGTPVIAAADGYAMKDSQYASRYSGFGDFILIRHDKKDENGKYFFTLYAHLSSIIPSIPSKNRKNATNDLDVIKDGWLRVYRGQTIGKSGRTNTFWPHLHFQVFKKNYDSIYTLAIDPYGLHKTTTNEDSSNYYPPEGSKTVCYNNRYTNKEQCVTRSSGSKYTSCGKDRLWLTDPPTPPNYYAYPLFLNQLSGMIIIKGQGFGNSHGTVTVDYRLSSTSMAPIEISNARFWTDNTIILDIFRDSLYFFNFVEPLLLKIYKSDGMKVGQLYFPFKDVAPDKWYAKQTTELWKKGVIKGRGNTGLYWPGESITFAEFLKILVEVDPNLNAVQCQEGDLPFSTDISTVDFPPYSKGESGGPWYCQYYKESSIQSWTEDLRALTPSRGWPKDKIKRKEVAFFLAKAVQANILNYPMDSGFIDVDNGDAFAPYIRECKRRGVFGGYEGGIFKPEEEITRAAIAEVFYKAFSSTDS